MLLRGSVGATPTGASSPSRHAVENQPVHHLQQASSVMLPASKGAGWHSQYQLLSSVHESCHSHPPDARYISHVMVSTYPKSPSHQHCSTLQVYSPDQTQATRNHHQPECHPLNSLSANHLPGSAHHLYLQRIACYTLQLHSSGVD